MKDQEQSLKDLDQLMNRRTSVIKKKEVVQLDDGKDVAKSKAMKNYEDTMKFEKQIFDLMTSPDKRLRTTISQASEAHSPTSPSPKPRLVMKDGSDYKPSEEKLLKITSLPAKQDSILKKTEQSNPVTEVTEEDEKKD